MISRTRSEVEPRSMPLLSQAEAVKAAHEYFPLAKKIASIVINRHKNHADDITSDLYLLLVDFLQTYDTDSKMKIGTFMWRFFRLRVGDYEKKTFRNRASSLSEIIDETGGDIEQLIDKHRCHVSNLADVDVVMRQLKKRLPPTYVRIMSKIFIDGLDKEQVAEQEGKTVTWVLRRYVHAFKMLRGEATKPHPGNIRPTYLDTEKKSLAEIARDPRSKISTHVLIRRLSKGMSAISAITKPPEIIMPPRRKLLAFGEAKSMREWSRDPRCVVSFGALQKRLKQGWDIEKAITQQAKILYAAFGVEKTLQEWQEDPRCSVTYKCLDNRIRLGMPLEEAIVTPNKTGHRWAPGESGNISGFNSKKGTQCFPPRDSWKSSKTRSVSSKVS